MTWRDDTAALWQLYGRRYPLDFIQGWIQAESGGNNQVAVINSASAKKLDEVGWFQISAEERSDLGLDRDSIVDDEDYSFRAGITLLDHYASWVDSSFTDRGYLGMVKLMHALPVLAKYVQSNYNGARDSWTAISDWIKSNRSTIDVYLKQWGNFSSLQLAQTTDKVVGYTSDFADFLAPVIDLFDSAGDSDTGGIVIVGVALAAALLLLD